MNSNVPDQKVPLSVRKNNSKKVFWIFAIFIFLVAFVVGGFFTGAKQNKHISQNQQEKSRQ
jgi:flagellar basal body-associated protein FliL